MKNLSGIEKIMKIAGLSIVFLILSSLSFSYGGQNHRMAEIAQAGGDKNVSGWAWNSNIGWVSFNSLDCDADGDNLSDGSPAGCPAAGTNIPDYGVGFDPVTGVFSGYAWSGSVGWIDFAPAGPYPSAPSYSAKKDTTTGLVTGWAKILSMADDGWIRLDAVSRERWQCPFGTLWQDAATCNNACFMGNTFCTFGDSNPGIKLSTSSMAFSGNFSNMPAAHDGSDATYGSVFSTIGTIVARTTEPVDFSRFRVRLRTSGVQTTYRIDCGFNGSGQTIYGPVTFSGTSIHDSGLFNYRCPSANEAYLWISSGGFTTPIIYVYEFEIWGSDPNQTTCPGSRPWVLCGNTRPASCTSYENCTPYISNLDVKVSTSTGDFSGWAWNGNDNGSGIGWLSFNSKDCDVDSNNYVDTACGGDNSTAAVRAYKVIASQAPNAPTIGAIEEQVGNCKTVKVNWTDNSGNELGFNVEKSTDGTNWTDFCPAPQTAPDVTSCINVVSPSTSYYFRARAVGASDSSWSTSPLTAIGFCAPALTEPLSANYNCDRIDLSWSQQGTGIDHYEVWRNKDAAGFILLTDDIAPATLNYADTDIMSGSKYEYRVKAQDAGLDSDAVGPINPCPNLPSWRESKAQ